MFALPQSRGQHFACPVCIAAVSGVVLAEQGVSVLAAAVSHHVDLLLRN